LPQTTFITGVMTSPVTIKRVETAADRKTFVNLPWALYADDPNWVPPLKSEMHGLIGGIKSNPWFGHAEAVLWLALWALAHPIAALVGLPEVADLLPWMAITLLIGGCMGVPAAFARRRGRYKALAPFLPQ
jgi:hypothetical protein